MTVEYPDSLALQLVLSTWCNNKKSQSTKLAKSMQRTTQYNWANSMTKHMESKIRTTNLANSMLLTINVNSIH